MKHITRNRKRTTWLTKEKRVNRRTCLKKNRLWNYTEEKRKSNRKIRCKERQVENTWGGWWKNTKEERNWLDLPEDVMILILKKVGVADVLKYAQMVCSWWHTLCKQPCLYSSIVLMDACSLFGAHAYQRFEDFFKEALRRSCGQTIEFSSSGMTTKNVFNTLVQQANSLKTIRLWGRQAYRFTEIVQGFPQLEQLEVRDTFLYPYYKTPGMTPIEKLGRFCQKLKYFHLHVFTHPLFIFPEGNFDDDALHIAKYMPQLHHLCMEMNSITNKGLQAILQGCPSLKFLALQQCSNITLRRSMLKVGAFSRIRNVRVWNESQHHFEFDLQISDEM